MKTKKAFFRVSKFIQIEQHPSITSGTRLSWIVIHKIAAMNRELKHQEILQSPLAIKNLNSTVYFSSPQLYQLIEPRLPVKIQEVPPNPQDIQSRPYKVWNYDKIWFDPNGNWNKIVCTYKFFTGGRLWRTHNGERAPFCCTALIFTRSDGQCFIPPVVVHRITHYTQDLHYNIPSDWVIHNSPSGYMDSDCRH